MKNIIILNLLTSIILNLRLPSLDLNHMFVYHITCSVEWIYDFYVVLYIDQFSIAFQYPLKRSYYSELLGWMPIPCKAFNKPTVFQKLLSTCNLLPIFHSNLSSSWLLVPYVTLFYSIIIIFYICTFIFFCRQYLQLLFFDYIQF